MVIRNNYIQSVEKVKKAFVKNKKFPSVTLFDFFDEKEFKGFFKEIGKVKFVHEREVMRYSWAKSQVPKKILNALNSPEVLEFVSTVAGRKINCIGASLYKFKHKDYTILHDADSDCDEIEIFLDFTPHWCGDYGGDVFYVDGKENYSEVPSGANTMTIVHKKKGTQKFIKYINNLSKGKEKVVLFGKVLL